MPYKDREKQRKYQQEWYAKRRSDWLSDKVCMNCGSLDQLEIDHIDRDTKVDHRIWSWSQIRRETELGKCQVLCHLCHVNKTWSQDFTRVSCGTNTRYIYYKCRCDKCKKAHAIHNSKYRGSLAE